MYNLLIALAVSLLAFASVLLFDLPWYAGIMPAVLVFPAVLFLLARRTGRQLQEALAPIQAIMAGLPQARSQAEAHAKLEEVRKGFAEVRDTFGPWQMLLTGQLDAQMGMLDYMQQRFADALPKLQKAWRDPMAALFEGCVLARVGSPEAAFAAFEKAASYNKKEGTIYVVWGLVALRKGQPEKALEAFSRGLTELPAHPELKRLRAAVANKQKVDPNTLGELWWRFFPEDANQQLLMRGRRDKGPLDGHVAPGGQPPRGRAARR